MGNLASRITQGRLKELVRYDPATGLFTWLTGRKGSPAQAGDPAGFYSPKDKIWYITLDRKCYSLRNIAWFYVHGEWPEKQLRHKDGDIANHAITNLEQPTISTAHTITVERLREVLSYDPETGIFRWKIKANKSSAKIGGVAGKVQKNHGGYISIGIDGADYMAQRLAWAYVHGEFPSRVIRFDDGDKQNCRIDNLRFGEFHYSTDDGRNAYDRMTRIRNPDRHKHADLKRYFGLTITEYRAMVVAHNGLCAICRQPETATLRGKLRALAVDHCHTTRAIRGLLCSACNYGIGHLGDDPARMRAAADYIERYAAATPTNVVPLKAKDIA